MKTVKQYSLYINNDNFIELQYIANQYKNVKNYVYSRYSGINSIPLLKDYRKLIRNLWVKSKFADQWKLPARYWKLALEESIANIKTQWSNVKLNIKSYINHNENLTKNELHYIRYILKVDNLYYKVLTCKYFDIPKKFINYQDIKYNYIHNMIRRLTRKYKGNIPYVKDIKSFMIDADMYTYELNDKQLFINIMTTQRRKRIKIQLTDKNIHKGGLRIILDNNENTLQIHKGLNTQTKPNNNQENIIGIDKGYRYLFAVSSDKFYGEGLNNILSKETERLNTKNQNRNRFWALYNQYLEQENIGKTNTIKGNNLGKVKYNHNKQKNDQTVKSYINYSLNQLIKEEKPTEIVMEQLDFVNWNDRYPKSVKRKLSRWIKGYIRERLEYKCNLNNITYTYINPAYTSKVCSICGSFGVRKGDVFTCPECGKTHADINASKNILNRKYDKGITIYTNYKKVKEILENRLKLKIS